MFRWSALSTAPRPPIACPSRQPSLPSSLMQPCWPGSCVSTPVVVLRLNTATAPASMLGVAVTSSWLAMYTKRPSALIMISSARPIARAWAQPVTGAVSVCVMHPSAPGLSASVPVAGLRVKTWMLPRPALPAVLSDVVYAVRPSGLTATFHAPPNPGIVVQPVTSALPAKHWRWTGRHCAEAGTAATINAVHARAIAQLDSP